MILNRVEAGFNFHRWMLYFHGFVFLRHLGFLGYKFWAKHGLTTRTNVKLFTLAIFKGTFRVRAMLHLIKEIKFYFKTIDQL